MSALRRATAIALLLLTTVAAWADLRVPQTFSDGMVLQRELPIRAWGWAEAGVRVTVAFAEQEVSVDVGGDGTWRLELDPLEASGEPREMQISALGEAGIVIKDVLVGEVWFTAGQSNMMMGLSSATGGAAFHEKHHAEARGLIRVVNGMGPHLQADTPQTDIAAHWAQPTASYSAVSYWFAHKLFKHFRGEVPIGMITYTAITGAEAWVDGERLMADPRLKTVLDDAFKFDSKCYNGVISAIAPYTMRGAIYYQAEYNGFGDRALQFRVLMPALIDCWRQSWQRPEMPILFVQLPGFIAQEAPSSAIDMDSNTLAKYRALKERRTWTVVRESQLLTWQSVPHTGMAVTIDLGESYDIHPPRKEPVADRLLLQARQVAYGEDLVHSGPAPIAYEVQQGAIATTFDHVGSGLVAQGGKLKGFEVAGSDVIFHLAEAVIGGNRVIARSDHVPDPVHLRYAWDGNPVATLYNREELPATPFRWTDRSRAHQLGTGSFTWPNPSFEGLNRSGEPIGWRRGPGTTSTAEMASDGKRAVAMTMPNKSGLYITSVATGTGAYWNGSPLFPAAVRPGCLVSYSVDIAVAPDTGEQKLYTNLCRDATGGGYQAWGGTRTATTASTKFVTRTIVQRLADAMTPNLSVTAGSRFIYQGGAQPGTLYVDNLTPVRILRPLLAMAPEGPVDLGQVAPGEGAASAEQILHNDQRQVFRQVLTDDDPGAEFATVLYGAATFTPDGMGDQQKIIDKTDHVGAVLIGPDAARFEFVSEHCGATKQQLKLIGPDGTGGLTGGPDYEEETFTIRFVGAANPGTYQATLRIVTQAGNAGMLSIGEAGEPPVDLYYVDRPITVRVGDSEIKRTD